MACITGMKLWLWNSDSVIQRSCFIQFNHLPPKTITLSPQRCALFCLSVCLFSMQIRLYNIQRREIRNSAPITLCCAVARVICATHAGGLQAHSLGNISRQNKAFSSMRSQKLIQDTHVHLHSAASCKSPLSPSYWWKQIAHRHGHPRLP